MAVKKPRRGSPAIDMTAMVDVAFLLLTFFILTTTNFREDASIEVDMPSSVSSKELPPTGFMTIYVSDTGRVFVGYTDIGTREKVLQRIINKQEYEPVSQEAAAFFSSIENFGVPFSRFPAWIEMTTKERENYEQQGIPFQKNDSLGIKNELDTWIRESRLADPYMKFSIRGDAGAPYPVVRQVISTLQDYNINQMSLVTNMEDPPSPDGGE